MTIDGFRETALSLPLATEASHMGRADFRVKGKIFATIYSEEDGIGMVKLTPRQQAALVRAKPGSFEPVKGSWGEKGATLVTLGRTDAATVRQSVHAAWCNTAPARLVKEFGEANL